MNDKIEMHDMVRTKDGYSPQFAGRVVDYGFGEEVVVYCTDRVERRVHPARLRKLEKKQ